MTLSELTAEMGAFRDAMVEKGHAPGEVNAWPLYTRRVYYSQCRLCKGNEMSDTTIYPCPGPKGG